MNISVQTIFQINAFIFLDKCLERELLSHMIIIFEIFR